MAIASNHNPVQSILFASPSYFPLLRDPALDTQSSNLNVACSIAAIRLPSPPGNFPARNRANRSVRLSCTKLSLVTPRCRLNVHAAIQRHTRSGWCRGERAWNSKRALGPEKPISSATAQTAVLPVQRIAAHLTRGHAGPWRLSAGLPHVLPACAGTGGCPIRFLGGEELVTVHPAGARLPCSFT